MRPKSGNTNPVMANTVQTFVTMNKVAQTFTNTLQKIANNFNKFSQPGQQQAQNTLHSTTTSGGQKSATLFGSVAKGLGTVAAALGILSKLMGEAKVQSNIQALNEISSAGFWDRIWASLKAGINGVAEDLGGKKNWLENGFEKFLGLLGPDRGEIMAQDFQDFLDGIGKGLGIWVDAFKEIGNGAAEIGPAIDNSIGDWVRSIFGDERPKGAPGNGVR